MASQTAVAKRGRLACGLLPGGDVQINAGPKDLILTADELRWLMLAACPLMLTEIEAGRIPEAAPKGQIPGQTMIAA